MPQYCPACRVGKLIPTRRTYVYQYGETLVHSVDVPALKCDACRLVIFDADAVARLELMIGEAGPPPNVPGDRSLRATEPSPADTAARDDLSDEPPRRDDA